VESDKIAGNKNYMKGKSCGEYCAQKANEPKRAVLNHDCFCGTNFYLSLVLNRNPMKNITATESITLNAPRQKVWDALTKPELIQQYFFGTYASSDWKVGSPITFKGEWEGKHYEDKGTILEVRSGRLLRYNFWSSMSGMKDKPENYVIITYELSENNGETLLTITQENIPTEEMKDHSEQNWRKVLEGLKRLVEGTSTMS
jgi:uncharacterized protein YndB with AHSA1/START domain